MNEPTPDDDLKALFAGRRAADHDRAPDFQAMRIRALRADVETPSPVTPVWRWAFPVTAALTLGIAVFLAAHQSPAPVTESREAAVREIARIDAALRKNLAAQDSLTAWQSPTDFLLNPNPSVNP